MPGFSGAAGGRNARQPDNTLALVTGGKRLTGWQSIRVTQRLEGAPSDFDLLVTERYPGELSQAVVLPGQPCKVTIGSDAVVTGYIDRYAPAISPNRHEVRIQGRGKCEDLVDCSLTPGVLNGMTVTTSSLVALAAQISKPFNIEVVDKTGSGIPVSIPGGAPLQFNATLTETCYEVIEKVARFAGVLPYEDGTGALILASVGAGSMASGFAQGVNVQQASVSFSMDGRFSEYLPYLMSTNFVGQQGVGGMQFTPVQDKGVPRYRPLIIVSEQWQFYQSFAELRAQWEAARRFGRSQAVRLTCDSWRDSAGALWQPNFFAPLNLPTLKLTPSVPWVIGEVSFLADKDGGTTAELTLMAKEAFTPEPTILMPFLWDPNSGVAPGGAVDGGSAPG